MLIQFTVENYMSYKNKATLNMTPSADKENPDNITTKNNYDALNTIAIYGSNASGKSNIFKAMTTAIMMIRNSNNNQINQNIHGIIPFKFDETSKNKPTKFEFIFIANDGIKYLYGYTTTQNTITEEYLFKYKTIKPTMIFERTNTTEYKFPVKEKKLLNDIATKNTKNKLFISTATLWNYEETKNPFIWFSEYIDVYGDYTNLESNVLPDFEHDVDGSLKIFVKKILREADINISDYEFKSEKTTIENIPGFSPELANLLNIPNEINKYEITTGHIIENELNKKENYTLRLDEESMGTKNLFMFSPILKNAFDKGKTILIDEIDKSLHPLLVKHILELFKNKNTNKNGAQLIFNTHDTNLLKLDFLRRDQIYFTEKNNRNGASELYSLDEFSVRKSENIEKGYLQGRYGAIPILGTGDFEWD